LDVIDFSLESPATSFQTWDWLLIFFKDIIVSIDENPVMVMDYWLSMTRKFLSVISYKRVLLNANLLTD